MNADTNASAAAMHQLSICEDSETAKPVLGSTDEAQKVKTSAAWSQSAQHSHPDAAHALEDSPLFSSPSIAANICGRSGNALMVLSLYAVADWLLDFGSVLQLLKMMLMIKKLMRLDLGQSSHPALQGAAMKRILTCSGCFLHDSLSYTSLSAAACLESLFQSSLYATLVMALHA